VQVGVFVVGTHFSTAYIPIVSLICLYCFAVTPYSLRLHYETIRTHTLWRLYFEGLSAGVFYIITFLPVIPMIVPGMMQRVPFQDLVLFTLAMNVMVRWANYLSDSWYFHTCFPSW
jgi:hypothetical protein